MGAQIEEGGKGKRRRSLMANLNLVPFIDLLSTCITFLLATAVWTQTESMLVDQAINDPNAEPPPPPETPPIPPMTVHVRADGVWLGRSIETGKNFPALKPNEEYDWLSVENELKADRENELMLNETQVVIVTDDGVNYTHMIKALDLSRANGFDKTLLGGGPAGNNASISMPPPTPG